MSLEADLHAAVHAALVADPTIASRANGVFVGRPVRMTPPSVVLGEVLGADWSVKGAAGRELRLTFTVVDAGESPGLLFDLVDASLAALASVPRTIGAWQLGPFVHLRSLAQSSGVGRWESVVDVRVRALQLN
jgi:hypothetical protein